MKFTKDSLGKWFAEVPEWTGERWELEMVCGADTMLDIVSQGEDEVNLVLSTTEPNHSMYDTLVKINDTPDIGGALYMMKTYKGFEYNIEIWLCHVTEFVFGELPKIIFIY